MNKTILSISNTILKNDIQKIVITFKIISIDIFLK